MKKIGAAALLLIFISLQCARAQTIQFNQTDTVMVIMHNDTLNNPWAGGFNYPLFSEVDLNGDGIHDIFVFDRANNRVSTFLNDGSPGVKAWHYAPQYVSKFPPVNKWAFLYDYNCDGKADFFTLAPSTSGLSVYRNDFDSAQGGLRFTLVFEELPEAYTPTFHAPLFVSATAVPTFGDVDGDGDMDILGMNSAPDGRVWYHKNYAMEDGVSCDSLDFHLDTETWGNFAMSQNIGGNGQVNCFNCRKRHDPPDIPDFMNYDQSEAARRDDSIFSIFMIDIDGDGDMDLLIGDSGANNTLLVTNGGTSSNANMVSQTIYFPSHTDSAFFCSFHFHAYIDVDNDGIKDLLVTPADVGNFNNVWYYKNTGTNSAPVFVFQSSSFLSDQMIEEGEGTCPALFDADGDGLDDLVTGSFGILNCGSGTFSNRLQLFKNIGTATAPAFELVDSDYANISSLFIAGSLSPSFGDLDGDGKKDMILGEADGKLQYFTNTGGTPANFVHTGINFMNIDVGSSSMPQLVDLDRDGDLDLVVGAQNGHLLYFENTGTVHTPLFASVATNSTLGGIIIRSLSTAYGFTSPFFFDDNGHYKLLLGCGGGQVYLYDSIEGNLAGNFHLADSIVNGEQGYRQGFDIAVTGGDLNHDQLCDFLLGIYSGGVGFYFQNNPLLALHEPISAVDEFSLMPNPADDQCMLICKPLNGETSRITILSCLGEEMFSSAFRENRFSFSTHRLSPGIYFVRLESGKGSSVKKLIVAHGM